MSLNPARSFASAMLAQLWTGFWIYLTAPLLGMLLAAEVHQRSSASAVPCAKLHHANDRRCIFRCRYAGAMVLAPGVGGVSRAAAMNGEVVIRDAHGHALVLRSR